jgi:PAS domain S-box-containing protein
VPWLYAGAALVAVHHLLVWVLRLSPGPRALVGSIGLMIAALTPVAVFVQRRRAWQGCQCVFWATIALGATLWTIGQIGWIVHEVVFRQELPWLQWYSVLSLVGSAAPLLALQARPHRGPRRSDAPILALDIAGLATIVAYLYLAFVIGPGVLGARGRDAEVVLFQWSQGQRLLLLIGMAIAMLRARGTPWASTFRKLTLAAAVGVVGRLAVNAAITRNLYYTGSIFDLAWTLPFFLYAWAAATSPASPAGEEDSADAAADLNAPLPSAPWLIFAVVAAVPVTEYFASRGAPVDPRLDEFRDIVSTVSEFVLLALLTMRVAVERSARQRTTAQLRLMAAAVRQTDDLTLILRADGRFEYANAAFCEALGYSRRELQRLPAEALLSSESYQPFFDLVSRVRGGAVARGSLTRVRTDGTTFTTSATMVPVLNAAGKTTHFVDLERDITDELKRRDQMIHAERLSAVGQLVSGVAHEINNPLQTIVGFTEMMLQTEQRAEVRKDLARIFTEANRAGKIVRNLLSFVRRSSHARTNDDLNDIAQSTVSLRAYELRVAGIEIVERYQEPLAAVFVNREEIQQVILNLILNAEHAMLDSHQGRRLAISTSQREDTVSVEIADDGPGVPAALKGQIFEPFFTTKEVGKGTGLGLSIAMGIAASHGGRLELAPAARGACFRLTLPAIEVTAPAAVAAAHERPGEQPEPQAGRRALVVDDEPAVRDLISRQMQRRGYRVDVAEDGEAAAGLAARREYDIILCDVKMPKMSGADVFARLALASPDVCERFVFVTGDAVAEDVATTAATHHVPVLSKPFTSAELDAVLASVGDRVARTARP